jgi:hypothetical protein
MIMEHELPDQLRILRIRWNFCRHDSVDVSRLETINRESDQDMGMRKTALLKFNAVDAVFRPAHVRKHGLQGLKQECEFPFEDADDNNWYIREILPRTQLRLDLGPFGVASHRYKKSWVAVCRRDGQGV